jgi:hypothetical protein
LKITPTGCGIEAGYKVVLPVGGRGSTKPSLAFGKGVGKPYGMNLFSELFTDRQLVALTTLSDVVQEMHERVKEIPKSGIRLPALQVCFSHRWL